MEAFTQATLAELTLYKLGARLDVMVNTNAGLGDVVFSLIQYVEKRGWGEEFIRGVYEERSDNQLIREFCNAHASFVFQPRPTTRELAQNVGAGLTEVVSRLHDTRDEIRAILAGDARIHLTELGTQFSRLRRYKVLHECLHNLQFKYVRLISNGLKILSTAPDEADNLRVLYAEMNDELTQCGPESRQLPSATAEAYWLNIANQSVQRLVRGLDESNAGLSTTGLQMLEGLLRVQPTRINELLTNVLEGIGFEHLVAAFDGISGHLDSKSLTTATTAMGSLAPRLNRVLNNHKDWQLVDNALRQIDTDLKLGVDPALGAVLWAEADRVLRTLIQQERQAPWAVELQGLADGLNTAFAGNDANVVKTAFNRLKARTSWFFYQADRDLKELASDLDAVGSKLGDILEEINDE